VTDHGKIDKKQLPSPTADATRSHSEGTPGLSEPEQFVLKVWSEDLGLKNIGLNDDFFDFGGTSLALIRSLSKLKAHYQINLDPAVLANGATAKVLADYISRIVAPGQFVLKVWTEDLGLKNIGLNDDFFDFGGTSLALIRSLSKLKSHYQINIDPAVLADGATAKALADYISRTLVQAH